MKTTKIVDITICDLCNEECYSLVKCVTCKKEVCTECMDSIHVSVRRNHKMKYHGEGKSRFKSYSSNIIQTEFQSTYCVDCGGNIATKLLAAGFVSKIESPAAAVMD